MVDDQTPRAGSGRELEQLLKQNHRYVFSLIHKFNQDVKPGNPYSGRDDLIVISDEAHRTQAGKLARNMRLALPNAAFIGITGTPLFKHDELTKRIFGDYISRYDFERSEEDARRSSWSTKTGARNWPRWKYSSSTLFIGHCLSLFHRRKTRRQPPSLSIAASGGTAAVAGLVRHEAPQSRVVLHGNGGNENLCPPLPRRLRLSIFCADVSLTSALPIALAWERATRRPKASCAASEQARGESSRGPCRSGPNRARCGRCRPGCCAWRG